MKVALFTLLCVPAAAFSPELVSATELGSAASSEEKVPRPTTHEDFAGESQSLFLTIELSAERLFSRASKFIISPLPSCQCFLCNGNEINGINDYCSAKQSEAGQDCFGNKDLSPGCYSSLDSYNCHCKIGTTDLEEDEIAQIDLPYSGRIMKTLVKSMKAEFNGGIAKSARVFHSMAEKFPWRIAKSDRDFFHSFGDSWNWKEVFQLADIADYHKALKKVIDEADKVADTIVEKQTKEATLKAMQGMKGVMQQAVEVCKKMLKVNEYLEHYGLDKTKASIMVKCPEI